MADNRRIAIFIKGLDLGGFSGGADLFGANLACELHKNNEQVSLFICSKYNTESELDAINSIRAKGVTPRYLMEWKGRANWNYYLQAYRKLAADIKDQEIEIIHSHFHTGTVLSILLKMAGRVKRVVRTAHVDHEWQRGWEGPIKNVIIRLLIFVVFPLFVDKEAGVSSYCTEELNNRWVARLLRKQAVVIPNAIPLGEGPRRNLHESSNSHWQGDHPVIGSVGRLEKQKGYTFFINAVPEVLGEFPDIQTWLIGDGPLRKELETECSTLGISKQVIFWGRQNGIYDFLSQMDLFVCSSLYEGLPTAVMEAMDAGVPCVVTDIPGVRDLNSGKNVLVVPAMDSKALAFSIRDALRKPELRKELSENSREIIERFRIADIAQAYSQVYRTIL